MPIAPEHPETHWVVLVVDDNPTNLDLLCSALGDRGWEILVATDGESAIEQSHYAQPHLILLDVMMPGIDGFETCRRLKADPTTAHIPVIFTTALADVERKVLGFQVGAVDYVTKPFDVLEVQARAYTHLKMQQLQGDLRASNRKLQEEIRWRKAAEEKLQAANGRLEKLAISDGLTGLANRREFDRYLRHCWQQQIRHGRHLSLLLCDVDYFKAYNDTYGHPAGDECLMAIAQTLAVSARRPFDLAARYGGEEFALVLPDTQSEGALEVAGMVRDRLHHRAMPHQRSPLGIVTLSIGMATLIPSRDRAPSDLLDLADRGLYLAKQQGRDRLCDGAAAVPISPPPPPTTATTTAAAAAAHPSPVPPPCPTAP
ncbi:MAG: diguanylate cyclase [Cyanophyceae cyanobacterium]